MQRHSHKRCMHALGGKAALSFLSNALETPVTTNSSANATAHACIYDQCLMQMQAKALMAIVEHLLVYLKP